MSIHRVTGCSNKKRTPLIYDPKTLDCFDGFKHFKSTKQQISEWSILKSYRSQYVPVKKEPNDSFEMAYNNFVELADELIYYSDNQINLYKTGTIERARLSYFFKLFNKTKITIEPITPEETRWINLCDHGQLYYKDKNYEGNAYSYDINSMYMAMMSSVNFKMPIKSGTFKKLSVGDFEKLQTNFFEYGIYRVNIQSDRSVNTAKMFRFNSNHYYSTIDLNIAKKLGLKMDLIVDGNYNFLAYGKGTCVTGSQVFKKFAESVYGWRMRAVEQKSKCAKHIKLFGSCLWGYLCQKNLRSIQYNNDDDNFEFDIDSSRYDILSTYEVRDNIIKVEFVEKDKYFKYDFARMKPFLLAYARQHLGRQIEGYLDEIVYVNTDGFRTKNEIDIELGTGLGQIKFEGLK